MDDDDERVIVPEWCMQVAELPPYASGCRGSEEFEGLSMARDAWGKGADFRNSGLTAFAYLWRRFGPPLWGSDPRKELCSYILATPAPGIFVTIGPSGSSLSYAVGYVAAKEIQEAIRKPQYDYWTKAHDWAAKHGYGNEIRLSGDKAAFARAVAEIGHPPELPDASKWRESEGPVHELNRAVFEALREMLRPVYIRDIPINILGRVDESSGDLLGAAECSRFAGLGVPMDAMEKLLEETS